jgi:adenine-specific DNA glycosylase
MIFFGRYLCMARKPLCETCPFSSFCPYLAWKISKTSSASASSQHLLGD